VQTLRDDPEFACDYFDFSSAVDLPDQEVIELVTHVYSTSRNHHVRVKVRVPRDEPRCATLSDLYPGANWYERETAELFGVVFEGLLVVIVFLSAPMVVGYMEHKVLAHMQARLGPMYAGRFHGWAQLIADGVKFVQKEDVVPRAADRWVFALAPAVAMIPYILLFAVIPFDDNLFAENLDVGIFYVLAASSISVIGVLMAGWASANKFSLIGALRAAAQLIAYELPMILAAVVVVMQAGTLSLVGITEAQRHFWYVFPQIVMFVIFVISTLAELTRTPF